MPLSSVCTTLGLTATLLSAVSQSASAAGMDVAPGLFFSTLPFTDTGSTAGMVNNINNLPKGTNTYSQVFGPDAFYTFTVNTAGEVTFKVTPTGNTGFDPSLYLLAGTPEGINAVSTTGRLGDTGIANVAEQFTVSLNPGTYFLVVDSFYASGPASAGSYLLDVTGTARIPEPGSATLAAAAFGTTLWRRRRRGARAR